MKLLLPLTICGLLAQDLAAQSESSESDNTSGPPTASVVWQVTFNKYTLAAAAFAPDGTFYIGGFSGQMIAMSGDGARKWSFTADKQIFATASIATDGTVYFGCRDNQLYALKPDGKLRWKFNTGGWVDTTPAIEDDGTLYFGSWDGKLYALSPDGTKRWEYKVGKPILSSPAIARDGTIYFGANDGDLRALNRDGSLRWSFHTAGAITGSPAVAPDGSVLIPSLDGNLYAVTAEGKLKWKFHTGDVRRKSAVIDREGRSFIAAENDLLALDAKGNLLWRAPHAVDSQSDCPAALAEDGSIYVTARNAWPRAYTREGQLKWVFNTGGSVMAPPMLDAKGNVIIANSVDTLFCLRGEAPPAKAGWPLLGGDARHTGKAR